MHRVLALPSFVASVSLVVAVASCGSSGDSEPATGGGAGGSAAAGSGGTGASSGAGGASGGLGGTVGSGGAATTSFRFFVAGDPRSNWSIFEDNVISMYKLDPGAIAVFATGDLTPTGQMAEWEDHQNALANGAPDPSVAQDPSGIVRQSKFRTEVSDWGPYIRYVGVLGNHDDGNANWLANWNAHFPGQKSLGVNGAQGIYFALKYGNTLFLVLDSVHDSAEQTAWLTQQLTSAEAQSAKFKLAFFHHAVYPCNDKSPFDAGLDWVTLFEQHAVDIAFIADSHTYERTCAMLGGKCADNGVVYLNSSGAGAGTRAVLAAKTDTVSHGGRTDSYDCAQILEQSQGFWHHFTHVAVEDCKLTARTFPHDHHSSGAAAFDTLVIDKCGF